MQLEYRERMNKLNNCTAKLKDLEIKILCKERRSKQQQQQQQTKLNSIYKIKGYT